VSLGGRPFYFGTNVKMHQTPDDTVRYLRAILDGATETPVASTLFVCPPFTSLPAATALTRAVPLWIGAQNMHWAASGAYTGEISPTMLTAVGVDLVLLGHAERRHHFGESDQVIRRKVGAAAEHGLRILLCVGETREERDAGVGPETIARQLKVGLQDLPDAAVARLMIAYEPVWAIGEGGTPATPVEAVEIIRHARAVLADRFGPEGEAVPILYGGSVDATNCGDFAALPEVDGLFVGRAVATADGFLTVCRTAERARRSATAVLEPVSGA